MAPENRRTAGFTLIEVMIVVMISGVLTSVAVPALQRYVKKSRTVEAVEALEKLSLGAKTYFVTPSNALQLPKNATGWYPKKEHSWVCAKTGGVFRPDLVAQFEENPWRALLFRPAGLLRYRHYWTVSQQHTAKKKALAYAEALGDLDCNNVLGRWRMTLSEDVDGNLRSRGPSIISGNALD